MRILQVQQGTDAWHAERARRFTASEAPAMMGASKYTDRSALLKLKATGLAPEVSAQKQALFDRGHAVEGPALAIVEEMIGEPLYPATAVHDTDDRLLASFDGVNMLETVIAEHKLWSESLAAQVQSGILDMHYVWQLEQQLLVSGAERAIFVCSDGTREKFVHMEYRPVKGRREALLAGWAQFEKDLAAYVPPAASAVEKIVAEPVEALPAVFVKVEGTLVVSENFGEFQRRLMHFLDHRLIREPKSDQDFANLDGQIKEMKAAEEALQRAEAQMLAQIQTVDQAKKTKDMLAKLVRDNRLMAERLLASEKERRREQIIAEGASALQQHVAALNRRLGQTYIQQGRSTAFADCIKGKRSLASMEDAVATELARSKIAANEVADRVQANLAHLHEAAAAHRMVLSVLFADLLQIGLKQEDDFRAVVAHRISAYEAEQRAKEEEQRARIRAEEEAKAREQARKEQEAQAAEARRLQQEQEAAARTERQRQEEAARAEQQRQVAAAPAPTSAPAPAPAPAANVHPMPTKAPAAPASPPTLRLGQINERLGFTVSADFLASLGYPMAGTEKAAKLWHEHKFAAICDALIAHIAAARDQRQAA